ncbi:uncharacterized protein LOC128953311 [Oppia nitens]|uniref:uncharacterized protein LOC128953311 n=1 Tax=Oppia nitens TaxID=1686743 RepID=UPI0023D98FE0|nr:uncharacterized protein LOC128953311 [Oppia nitens]
MASTGWYGMAVLLVNGMIACLSGVCLAKCWLILEERYPQLRRPQRNPFALIGLKANGKWMSYLCSAVMDLTFFGAPVVFLLICSDQIHELSQPSRLLKHLTVCDWIVILGLLLLPFTLWGSPADCWPVAWLALATTVGGLVFLLFAIGMDANLTVTNTTTNITTNGSIGVDGIPYTTTTTTTTHPGPQDWRSFFLGFGIITFGFGGAAAFPTIQTDMTDRLQFPKAICIAFCVVMFLFYLPVSIAGYYVYGQLVTDNILQSLSKGWPKQTASVLFTVHLLMAAVMLLNPVAQEFEHWLNIPQNFTYKRLITRSVLMLSVVFTGLSVPKFGKIMDLLGGSTIMLMAMILPTCFYLSLVSQQHDWPDCPKRQINIKLKLFMLLTICMGLVAGCASTYFAIVELVDPDSFIYPCYLQCNAWIL